jgi:hypothetical protein
MLADLSSANISTKPTFLVVGMHLEKTVAKESKLTLSFKSNLGATPRCHNYCGRKCKVRRATGIERGPTAEDGNNFYSFKHSPTTISLTMNVRT